MTPTPITQSTRHPRLKVDRFYWALLTPDAPVRSSRELHSPHVRDALDQVFGGPRVLVRPLAAKDGFTVVREDRGSDRNHYATALVARVTEGKNPHPVIDPWEHPQVPAVRDAFATQLGRLPAAHPRPQRGTTDAERSQRRC